MSNPPPTESNDPTRHNDSLFYERKRGGNNALLIQPYAGGSDPSLLEEFAELAASAGANILGTATARIDKPNAATLIGKGKLEEIKAQALAVEADLILVNFALSPTQERNLERVLQARVVDRTGLILDIFAQRARTHEGKLQVELAQLKHLSTRLVRGWTHLERQRGGAIGLRGPGETQLEMDRRIIQRKLESLQRRLDKVEVQRTQMRRARVRSEVPRVALVGYTNAGKSTLFNQLTGADAYAADQLFATLDPTVRKLTLPTGDITLADTVGFVRDLPHDLVAAFRSTLSEAREADLLLHVIDAADPIRDERIGQVNSVLKEIGAADIPQILVFNKVDLLEGRAPRLDEPVDAPRRVWLSAATGEGMDLLHQAIAAQLDQGLISGELRLPLSAGKLHARLQSLGAIREQSVDEHGWRLEISLPLADVRRLQAGPHGDALDPLIPPTPDPNSF